MPYFRFLFILFLSSKLWCQEELLSIQGKYQGGNLLVSNPPQSDGFGYCITKVTVNGDILPATIQSSVFEVNFKLFNLKIGEEIFIILDHAAGCIPTFMNPEVLLPKSTFICEKISCTNSGMLTWTTVNENGVLDFIIEQYRWGKWVEMGYVKGNGGAKQNSYTFQTTLHSGKNTLRISQRDNSKKLKSSKTVSVESKLTKVIKTPSRVRDIIYFKSNGLLVKTKFEVFDAYGNLLKQGYGQEVNCSNLLNGIYYLNFDNQTEKFYKID